MAGKGKELLDELRLVVTGKTLDALLPPLVFAITNGFWGLNRAVFVALSLSLLLLLLRSGDALRLAWANTLLEWPVTGTVLIISYLYGIWRLHNLGGPGVDEYQKGVQPPWRGQVRGF